MGQPHSLTADCYRTVKGSLKIRGRTMEKVRERGWKYDIPTVDGIYAYGPR